MAWDYDQSQLATVELYQIRAEIQDTDPADQQLSNEEIVWAASQERNFWCAAARCLEMISRKMLRKADVRLGRAMMVTYTKMAEQLLMQAKDLRKKSLGSVAPWVGGMSVTDKLTYMQNPDLIQGQFSKNLQQNPWAGGYPTETALPIGGGPQNPEIDNI